MVSEPALLSRAYGACADLARSHYENFPVASFLVPAHMRPHVTAIYAFARIADDIADEGNDAPAERRARLRQWQQLLHEACERPGDVPATTRDQLIVLALSHTMHEKQLPLTLFDDLISAFAQDITTNRYDSWEDVFSYCRRSANPVGRLVLLVAGDHRDEAASSSDALCTALQLTNFWQDFGRDWRHGRLYVPQDVIAQCGARESDLDASRWTAEWSRAIERCVAVTRELFDRGRQVCDEVRGRLRLELRATWLGGSLVLDRIAASPDAVLFERPRLRRADVPLLAWRMARWRSEAA